LSVDKNDEADALASHEGADVRPNSLPDWHFDFSANADVAAHTVHARGDLDLRTVEVLRGTVDVLRLTGQTQITIDLGGVRRVDQSAVAYLVALQHEFAAHSGRLNLVDAQLDVVEALHAEGLECSGAIEGRYSDT
jgi:anti-anti-sigma factor